MRFDCALYITRTLTSAKTRCPCSPDAPVSTSVFWVELRLEFGGKTITGLYLWHHKHSGIRDHQICISVGPKSWWGLEQSVFWDLNQSMTLPQSLTDISIPFFRGWGGRGIFITDYWRAMCKKIYGIYVTGHVHFGGYDVWILSTLCFLLARYVILGSSGLCSCFLLCM